jgi:diaminopimelate decarboxylase
MNLTAKDWGFSLDANGGLLIGGLSAETLAREYGTPLHLIDEDGLRRRARGFRETFEKACAGPVRVHYALKCNNTPGIVRMVLDEGLRPEVGTVYEWLLARRLGVPAEQIVVNGPHKGPLLGVAVREGAGLVVADGPGDLDAIAEAGRAAGRRVAILLRVNPNCVPKGMNRASATGSRRNSVFGFDPVSGEIPEALARVKASAFLEFLGFHCHAGTGIRHAQDYAVPVERLLDCALEAENHGLTTRILDIGGGFGVPTSRELNTVEFLLYQAAGRLPDPPDAARFPEIDAFARAIAGALLDGCRRRRLAMPEVLIEPGRSIVSSSGVLLLTVGQIKRRAGVGTWAITDGGAGTVAFPLFYEYHEVLLCRDAEGARTQRYTIVGPACFSADWIYRNKRMPELRAGDVLAVCDAGAYFTVQESNFGFARPAIVAVRDHDARLLRRRETFEDMVARDIGWSNGDGNGH